MSDCVATIHKVFVENLQFIRCRRCKERFEQPHYRQYYCQNVDCKRVRRTEQQIAYRRKKAGIMEVSE